MVLEEQEWGPMTLRLHLDIGASYVILENVGGTETALGKDASQGVAHPNPEGYANMQQAWLPVTHADWGLHSQPDASVPWCRLPSDTPTPDLSGGRDWVPAGRSVGAEGPQSYANTSMHKSGQARRQSTWVWTSTTPHMLCGFR